MPSAPDAWAIRNDVWNTLADWVNNRFLVQSEGQPGDRDTSEPGQPPCPETSTLLSMALACGRFQARFFTDSAPLVNRIESLLEPMAISNDAGKDSLPRLEIVRDTPGFTLILEGQVIHSRLSLAAIIPALASCLATHAARHDDIAIDAGLVAGADSEMLLVCHSEPSLRDALTLALSTQWRVDCGRGALLKASDGACVEGLGLPLQDTARERQFVAAQAGVTGYVGRVPAVLVPSENPVPDSSGVQAVTVNETLRHLISSCCGEDGRPLDTDGFTRLAGWLESRECYLVDMNNLEAASAALSGRCFEKAPQTASGGR
jgi:hypothetical protein